MTIEKKIFAFIADYDGRILPGKKWFVCYRTPDYKTGDFKKVKYYGDINKYQTVPERYIECEKIKSLIINNKHLPNPKERRLQKVEIDRNFASVIHLLTVVLNERKIDIDNTTYINYKSMITILDAWFKKENMSDLTIGNFTEDLARDFLLHLKKSGIANKTHNNYKVIFGSLWKDISRKLNNFLKIENVWNNIKSLKKNTQPFKVYTTEIEKILVKELPSYDRQLWLYVLFTHYGFLRGTENRKLKIEAIDFEAKTITIKTVVSKISEQRIITIPSDLYSEIINQKLQDYPKDFYIFSAKGFPSIKPASKNFFSTKYFKFRLKYKIPSEFKIYPLKHTGMIKAVQSGIELKSIQKQAGHHSLDQTNDYLVTMDTNTLINLRDNFPKLGELPKNENAQTEIKNMLMEILAKIS